MKTQTIPFVALTQNRLLSRGLILAILIGVLAIGLWVGYQLVDAQDPQIALATFYIVT
jgi:hypothetical protein